MKQYRYSMLPSIMIFIALLSPAHAATSSQNPHSPQILAEVQSRADKGDAKAQYELGIFLMDGDIGEYPVKVMEGVEWLTRSANRGYAPAQYKLGYIFYAGPNLYDCLSQVPEKAYLWYSKAAEQNHVEAQYELAMLYNPETGFKRYADKAKYLQWMQKAADLGYAQAQYTLGHMYEQGNAVQRNLEQAMQWYEKAALQGHASAKSAIRKLIKRSQTDARLGSSSDPAP